MFKSFRKFIVSILLPILIFSQISISVVRIDIHTFNREVEPSKVYLEEESKLQTSEDFFHSLNSPTSNNYYNNMSI